MLMPKKKKANAQEILSRLGMNVSLKEARFVVDELSRTSPEINFEELKQGLGKGRGGQIFVGGPGLLMQCDGMSMDFSAGAGTLIFQERFLAITNMRMVGMPKRYWKLQEKALAADKKKDKIKMHLLFLAMQKMVVEHEMKQLRRAEIEYQKEVKR